MKDLIGKLQKDLSKLQETVEKEGNNLLRKIKTAAKEKGMPTEADQIADLIETQIKKFEPAFEKFYQGVKVNAGKYGINLNGLEERVVKTATAARKKIKKKSGTAKSTAGKGSASKTANAKKTTSTGKKTTRAKKVTSTTRRTRA